MHDKGSAMITAVISIMILLLVSGIFFSLVLYQARVETSEEKALKAYYAAEAGINYEVAAVLDAEEKNQGLPKDQLMIDASLLSQNQVAMPGGQGTFSVKVLDKNDVTFTVASTGVYQGVTRSLQETYKFTYPPVAPNPAPTP